MSWRATAHVKGLTTHQDGTPLSAREKLILFVLADSHNDDYDYAWPGIDSASHASLTSRRRFIDLMQRLEKKGTILVERREGRSNLYRFPNLPKPETTRARIAPPSKRPVQLLHPTRATATALGGAIATAPEPLSSLHVTDIPAPSPVSPLSHQGLVLWAIEESHRTGKSADQLLRERKAQPCGTNTTATAAESSVEKSAAI